MDYLVKLIRSAEEKLKTCNDAVKRNFLEEGISELRWSAEKLQNPDYPRSEIHFRINRGLVLLENGGCFDDER